MADIAGGGEGSACSSDAPRAKNAKNEENTAATDSGDSEMRVVDSDGQQSHHQQQQHQENRDHTISGSKSYLVLLTISRAWSKY